MSCSADSPLGGAAPDAVPDAAPERPTSPRTPIRVLAVDDHPLVLEGVASMIRGQPDMTLVAEASDGAGALAQYRAHRPDVTLMDLRLPGGMDGVEALRRIRAGDPAACVVALTSYEGDADIRRALDAGARGYLLKDMLRTQLRDAIRTAARGGRVVPAAVAARLAPYRGEPALTARELEVLVLVARGLGNAEIADALGRATGTVKIHVQNILAKLGAADRAEAVAVGVRRGYLHLG